MTASSSCHTRESELIRRLKRCDNNVETRNLEMWKNGRTLENVEETEKTWKGGNICLWFGQVFKGLASATVFFFLRNFQLLSGSQECPGCSQWPSDAVASLVMKKRVFVMLCPG